MKQLLLFLFFIPSLLWAQDNSKYLAGAVTEQGGKVVFTKEIKAPALSEAQIYDIMLQWAKERFNTEETRVVYTDKEKGDIAAVGEEYLVFQNTALSLDRTLMNYRVTIKCEDHSCTLTVNGIRYQYNVSYQREPEKYLAEEWITDKFALNKDKTKLYRGNGKFRVKTIDFMDALFNSAASALGIQSMSIVPAAQAAQPAATVQPAQILQPAQAQPAASQAPASSKEGYTAFTADKIPSTLLQMLPESNIQIAPEKDVTLKETDVTWKGSGKMFGKSIASTAINPNSQTYKTIGDGAVYTISFFKEGENGGAWLIMECRKVGETAEDNQMIVMGEIINVWVK